MEMDLSWCIMCDKRIVEDETFNSHQSLYCSLECQMKDQGTSLQSESTCNSMHSISPDAPQQFNNDVLSNAYSIEQSTNNSNTNSNIHEANSLLSAVMEKAKPWMTKRAVKHHLYKASNPSSTAYPWVPLIYRKRRNYLTIPKRCAQPTVASSFTTVNGILSS
ncbi:hypothetical protein BDF20DRAFT_916356 [Mycotypha africana]|uniref:uncharacterized protein n=1 Tax=Mycotypha africana TaxID=64632 RepID=UPI0023015E57|nr:uncharacterized protein BDF20DRAFT_916356 [Mycotypha africana]KAI8968922.1 hypothetical protein BDF20DRAFT_916356 [Mycotypha africana]